MNVGLLWTCLFVVGLWSASDLAGCVCPWSDRASCACLRLCPCRVSDRAACPSNDLSFCRLICLVFCLVTCRVACPWSGPFSALSSRRVSSLWTNLAASCMVLGIVPACEQRWARWPLPLVRRLWIGAWASSPSIYSAMGDQMLSKALSRRVLTHVSRSCLDFDSRLRLLGARQSFLGLIVA